MSSYQREIEETFRPSFTGGRQEKDWLLSCLGGFFEDCLIDDILHRVSGGKEATVYCCRAHPATGRERVAAKVFRPRIFRAMKNDALYKTGRPNRSIEGKHADSRSSRALRKRTSYGRFLDSVSWCNWEYETLALLSADGADVPRPFASAEDAILMEYVGDERGPAPTLASLRLEIHEARRVMDQLVENVELLLSRLVVHADLSAYNVLYHEGQIYIIDFPQAVDASRHPRAFELFQRDIHRLTRYFVRQGVPTEPDGLAMDLWKKHLG